MQVAYKGARDRPVTLSVADTAPAIFALAGGTGQGAIFNQDLTLNSAANPAPRGSFMVLYATGEGQTVPAGIDGTLAQAPSPVPLFPVSLSIGGSRPTSCLPAVRWFRGFIAGQRTGPNGGFSRQRRIGFSHRRQRQQPARSNNGCRVSLYASRQLAKAERERQREMREVSFSGKAWQAVQAQATPGSRAAGGLLAKQE